MLLSSKLETKEVIISALSNGAIDSVLLQKKVEKIKKITKQGFYKVLRELVQEEVIVKNKQLVVLSNVWVNRLHDFANKVDTSYRQQANNSFLDLEEGDSLVYRFNSIPRLDALWMHYFFIIAKNEVKEPVVIYNLHEFWSLARPSVESFMYKLIVDNNIKSYILVGDTTSLDKSSTRYIRDMGISIGYEKTPWMKKNVYRTVIGDYVIDTVLDLNTINKIDELYKNNSTWNKELKDRLDNILLGLKRSKIAIEKNKRKADQFRKRVLKYFAVYK